jgi:hypothetical protein
VGLYLRLLILKNGKLNSFVDPSHDACLACIQIITMTQGDLNCCGTITFVHKRVGVFGERSPKNSARFAGTG